MTDRIGRYVVASIFGFLVALLMLVIVVNEYFLDYGGGKIQDAVLQAQSIETAIKFYHHNNGFYPASLDDVTSHLTQGKAAIVDPWGRPYEYAIEEGRAIIWTTSPKGERIQWPCK